MISSDSINYIFNPIEESKKQVDAIYDIVNELADQRLLNNRSSNLILKKEDPELHMNDYL